VSRGRVVKQAGSVAELLMGVGLEGLEKAKLRSVRQGSSGSERGFVETGRIGSGDRIRRRTSSITRSTERPKHRRAGVDRLDEGSR
jgi:hypothetical protein